MRNQQLEYVAKLIDALDSYFNESSFGEQRVLYSSAQLLDDETTVAEAIAKAKEMMAEPESEEPIVPRSQRRRIARNFCGNWVGFVGKRKVRDFGLNLAAAHRWYEGLDK